MNNRWWLPLLAGALILGLAACTSNEPASEETAPAASSPDVEMISPAPEPPADDAPAAPETPPVDEPTVEPEPAAVAPVEVTPPPEDAFTGAQSALDQLTSYRYQTLFSFVGEDDGEVESGSIELIGIVAGPNHKHLIWRDLGEDEQFEVIQIENRAWIFDEEAWEEAPVLVAEAMSQAVLVYAPSVAWGGIFGELEPTATYVGEETVNGVLAHHYTSTYAAWGGYWPGSLEDATGDVWIAVDGYPVKYAFTATGVDEDGDHGTVTWQMDLSDVNAEITIEAPVVTEDETL